MFHFPPATVLRPHRCFATLLIKDGDFGESARTFRRSGKKSGNCTGMPRDDPHTPSRSAVKPSERLAGST